MTTFNKATVPWWFIAVLVVMVAAQIVRLNQSSPADWILWDYIGRVMALALLAAIPAARRVAFANEQPKTDWIETLLWTSALIVGFLLIQWLVAHLIGPFGARLKYGHYPHPDRWLYLIDITIGLALVAYHEEIVFRRCARAVLGQYFGQGMVLVVASAALFAAYHWWTGIGSIFITAIVGAAAMAIYLEFGRLWPVIVAHYAIDVIDFS